MKLLSIPALALAAVLLPASACGQTESGFDAALAAHLAAIERRDWPAFEATLTRADSLTLVLPNGRLSQRRADFAKAMQAWLADPDWRWQLRPVSRHASAHTGVAMFEVDYSDVDAKGERYALRYLLGLVFSREADGQWRLVHDQNTPLPAPR